MSAVSADTPPKLVDRRSSTRILQEGDLLKEISKANASSKARRERKRRCLRLPDPEIIRTRIIVCWRHPYARLLAPLYIMISDLISHAADPNDHAEVEYAFPLAGEAWSLLNPFIDMPMPPYLVAFKTMAALLAIHVGIHIPLALQTLLQRTRCCRSNRFLRGDRALSMLPLLSAVLCLVGTAQLWNWCLSTGNVPRPPTRQYDQADTEYFTPGFEISYRISANALDTLVFVLDFLALFLVIDVVLQDGSQYPEVTKVKFAGGTVDLRKVWTQKWNGRFRIIVTWVIFISAFFTVFVFTWSRSRDWMIKREDEVGFWAHTSWIFDLTSYDRAFLYASQFLFDVLTVLQDWEFPTFDNQLKIALFGTNIAFEGRFANYFAMVAVACVDLKCLVATMLYEPLYVAQYVDEEGYVWAIQNRTLISQVERGALFPDFQQRAAEGCFRFLTKAELWQTGCHNEFIDRGGYQSYVHPRFGFAMAGGRNACCDIRIRARWRAEEFNGEYAMRKKLILVVPLVMVLLSSRLLAHFIARSRKEMCRRVILCQRIFEQLLLESRVRQRADSLRVHHSFVEMRWKVFDASAQDGSTSPRSVVGEDTQGEDSNDEDEMGAECSGQYGIRLLRPPVRGCPLLLVCSDGVYSIEAGINATIQDLIDQLHREGFVIEGIAGHRLRLRIKPYGHLNPQHYLGTLLPRSRQDDAVCIFVHGKLETVAETNREAITWPQAIARHFRLGGIACVRRVCHGCGVVCGCRNTCRAKCQECFSCCGLAEAWRLFLHGGQAPVSAPTAQWANHSPALPFQTAGRNTTSERPRHSVRFAPVASSAVELTGSFSSSEEKRSSQLLGDGLHLSQQWEQCLGAGGETAER